MSVFAASVFAVHPPFIHLGSHVVDGAVALAQRCVSRKIAAVKDAWL